MEDLISTDDFAEVLKALGNLYAYYYGIDEDSVQISPETKEALDTLMEAYDKWLD